MGQIPPQTSKQEPVPKPAERETPGKQEIPPKPVMSTEATAYSKLFKIYKELKQQNETIFEAEWKKLYGTDSHKQDKESIHERLKNHPKITTEYQQQRAV